MKLFNIVRIEADERFLNEFNNAIALIFDVNDYTVSICVCTKIFKYFALESQQYSIDFK